MVDALLDTTVLVDLLRLYAPAQTWFAQQEQQFSVSAMTWLEVIHGMTSKVAQTKAIKLLNLFEKTDPTPADFTWAIKQAALYKLSHNVSAIDCLIAATSYRLQVPLYTSNLKHFAVLLGKLAQNPY